MKGKLITIFIIILVLFGLFYLLSSNQVSAPTPEPQTEPVVKNTEPVNIPEGWKTYIDNGLGFSFAYPQDWSISLEDNSSVMKKIREEQVVLKKGNAVIIIDPLGRRGADESLYPITSEDLMINGVSWKHHFFSKDIYHRFTVQDTAFSLKIDSSTDGIASDITFNEPYTFRGNFRVHLDLKNVSNDTEKENDLKIVSQILDSLVRI